MIIFIVTLIICIITHELAHFIAAKLCGCGVDIFSVGMGKPYLKMIYKDTEYRLTPWLIGGYCSLRDELVSSNKKDSFTNLPYLKKMYITLAGVAVNILTGLLAMYVGVYYIIPNLWFFGYISLWLGITNLLPIPALDGSYIFLVWLEKFMGKEKGYALMEKLCKIGFIIITVVNIICIPWIIYLFCIGRLTWF